MKISSVTIQNFRGIENMTLHLDDITVLIGENNRGKTSVLEALEIALSPSLRGRGDVFDIDDHRYTSKTAKPGDVGPTIIQIRFKESSVGEWEPELLQALNDVLAIDATNGLSSITFRVKSEHNSVKQLETDWAFLDNNGNPLTGVASSSETLRKFQQITPYFMIHALRDADREFQSKGGYWGPFIRDLQMSSDSITEFEEAISALNTRIIAGHGSLQAVQSEVAQVSELIGQGFSGGVSIDPLPARIADVVSRSTVNVQTAEGAKIPLGRHGAGLQSLSVFMLFRAFVKSQLQKRYDPLSSPVVGIEEPETHLHPSAARVFAHSLTDIGGQKIVTSHSGEVISGIPMEKFRRLYAHQGRIQIGQINLENYDASEKRKVTTHPMKASRV